eukprot:TRINITY_DN13428_c0_g1_i1.p1 TRINITY_DN13428_c0_g1~~TRINITY_DN13428_c0_g1_i1.p1  ORF type:complete len:256 (-),score=40.28 TRINITY_DN13428_c0_g1_i1:471-1238(-)
MSLKRTEQSSPDDFQQSCSTTVTVHVHSKPAYFAVQVEETATMAQLIAAISQNANCTPNKLVIIPRFTDAGVAVDARARQLCLAYVSKGGETQKSLANQLEISPTVLSQWLHNKYVGNTRKLAERVLAHLPDSDDLVELTASQHGPTAQTAQTTRSLAMSEQRRGLAEPAATLPPTPASAKVGSRSLNADTNRIATAEQLRVPAQGSAHAAVADGAAVEGDGVIVKPDQRGKNVAPGVQKVQKRGENNPKRRRAS